MKHILKLFGVCVLWFAAFSAFAQTGPGGVGNASGSGGQPQNRLWLRADAGTSTTTNGQPVSGWNDQSGNGNNASQGTSGSQPLYIASEPLANNRPVLRFDGSDDWMQTTTHLTNNVGTLIVVGRKTAISSDYRTIFTSQDFLMLGQTPSLDEWGAYNDGGERLFTPGTSIGVNSSAAFRILGYRQNGLGANQLALFLDGVQSTTLHNGGGNSKGITTIGSNSSGTSGIQHFPGDIAEVIFYSAALNEAQRIIVENYLSSKYGVSIGTNDRYAYDGTHGNDVAGIGQASDGSQHTNASSNRLNINSPSSLANNRFALFGHNNGALTLSNTNAPASRRRLNRVWRINVTGGSIGTVTLAFDVSGISLPSGTSISGILVDADGDFSSGATELTGTLSGGIYTVTGASIPDGSYITLARTLSTSPTAPVSLTYTPNTLTLVYGTSGSSVPPDVDDGDSPITNYALVSPPTGISINASTGVISVAGTVNVGTYTLSVSATNGVGTTTFNNVYTVTVQPFDVSSVVYNNTTTSVGAAVNFVPTPAVPAGSGVSFSASGLAPLTINATTGEITGSAFTSETVYQATVTISSSGSNSTGGPVTRTLTIAALGATGPGGVGASGTNRLWLRADAGTSTTTNGQPVSGWNDQSGNGNNASQGTGGSQPLYIASEPLANNRPVLRFDGSDDWMQTTTHLTNNVGTLMIVARKTAPSGGYLTIFTSQDFLMLGRTPSQDVWGAYNDGGERLFTPGTSIGVNSSAAFRILGYRQNGSGANQLALFLDGVQSTTLHNGGDNGKGITTIGSNSGPISQNFPGDIAEVIFYGAALNEAQRIIVENYLSSKYGVSIGTNDRYAYDGTHGNDVAGIGQASDGSQHLNASSNRLNINSPSSLANNRFALFGHNNGTLTITNNNAPASRRRLNRVWRVNVTGGSIGTVTLAFDVSGISLPSGSSISGILVDADGDFSSGATELTGTLSGGIYTVTGASIPDGSYITLARTLSTSPTAPVSLTYTPNTLTLVYGTSGSSVPPDVDDGDSPITNYALVSPPTGISINASTGVISVAGTTNAGTYTLSVSATNGVGTTTFNNVYTVVVQPFDVSSVVYNTTTTSVGAAVNFVPTPAVPAGSGVSFSASGLAPLSINSTTGEITGSAFTSETVYQATVTISSSGSNSTGGPVTRTLTIAALGATGPGGVGASGTNRLWLRADAGTSTTTNGQPVSGWNDQSGNGNNASQGTGGSQPLYIASEPLANNRPVLRFDGSDDWMQTTTNLTDNVGTLIVVGRKTALSSDYRTIFTSQDFLMLGRTPSQDVWGAYNDGGERLFTPGTSIGANSSAAFRILGYRQSGLGANQLALFLDGVVSTTLHNGGGNSKGITTIGSNSSGTSGIQHFPGDIAEVIFYRAPINAAQRIIVENYLSAKYGVTIPAASDFYNGTSPYIEQVHGIGTTDGTVKHTRAQSSGGLVLEERNNSLNGTNEFLLAGHNGVDATPISIADLPSGVQQRWSRIWYLDKTGTIDARIAFDFSDANVPITPGVPANYRLLYRVGTSGTFSEVTIVGTPFIQNTDQIAFDVNDANLQDGYYTLGTTNPVDSPLPVELLSFTLTPKDKGVMIQWETGSELNNAGFILQRSLFRESSYTEIASYRTHEALRGLGTSPIGRAYTYFDSDRLQAGRTYFYKLLDVDFSGNITEHPVKEITLPNEYSLSQNYPNPFNPTTTIEFSLRQDGRTVLEVFNILGQVVARPIDGELKAGAYQVQFNASGLSSGLYFYRLRSGAFVSIKKMMLLK